jgi:hypothetical protein
MSKLLIYLSYNYPIYTCIPSSKYPVYESITIQTVMLLRRKLRQQDTPKIWQTSTYITTFCLNLEDHNIWFEVFFSVL